MATLTVRVPEELEEVLNQFCKEEDRSKSWLIKKALQEKLEDWQDLREGLRALQEHEKNPRTVSHKNLMKELGLTDKELV